MQPDLSLIAHLQMGSAGPSEDSQSSESLLGEVAVSVQPPILWSLLSERLAHEALLFERMNCPRFRTPEVRGDSVIPCSSSRRFGVSGRAESREAESRESVWDFFAGIKLRCSNCFVRGVDVNLVGRNESTDFVVVVDKSFDTDHVRSPIELDCLHFDTQFAVVSR